MGSRESNGCNLNDRLSVSTDIVHVHAVQDILSITHVFLNEKFLLRVVEVVLFFRCSNGNNL